MRMNITIQRNDSFVYFIHIYMLLLLPRSNTDGRYTANIVLGINICILERKKERKKKSYNDYEVIL